MLQWFKTALHRAKKGTAASLAVWLSLCIASSIFCNWEKTAAISKGPAKEKIACSIFGFPLCYSPALRRGGKGRERHPRQGKDWTQGRCRSCATGLAHAVPACSEATWWAWTGTPHRKLESDMNCFNSLQQKPSMAWCVLVMVPNGELLPAGSAAGACLPQR